MTIRTPLQPITTELYRQLPEGPPYYQLIEGNLILSPSANFFHQKIVGRLYHYIEAYLEEHPVGEAVIAPSDVFLDEINVFQPDLYFVKNENRQVLAYEGVKGAPDLVVEVLSPSTEAYDRGDKFDGYRGIESFEEYVLISQKDASAQTFFRQADGTWVLTPYSGKQEIVKIRSLGIDLSMAEIYAGVQFQPQPEPAQDLV